MFFPYVPLASHIFHGDVHVHSCFQSPRSEETIPIPTVLPNTVDVGAPEVRFSILVGGEWLPCLAFLHMLGRWCPRSFVQLVYKYYNVWVVMVVISN